MQSHALWHFLPGGEWLDYYDVGSFAKSLTPTLCPGEMGPALAVAWL